jgi:hypothetical protein
VLNISEIDLPKLYENNFNLELFNYATLDWTKKYNIKKSIKNSNVNLWGFPD